MKNKITFFGLLLSLLSAGPFAYAQLNPEIGSTQATTSRVSHMEMMESDKETSEVPAIQWNFNGHHTLGGATQEWVFSVLPTDRKEYIAVGYTTYPVNVGGTLKNETKPVIMKLDKLGRLLWIKSLS